MINGDIKEIGGYIELEKSHGNEYHKSAIALNSARHCIEYLILSRKISKIFLPYFLCGCVAELCNKCKCEYSYYNIDEQLLPVFNHELNENEYILIVNYYGRLGLEEINQYKIQYKNIIVDNTQAFFDYPAEDVDTIYSCRKFFGVPDGGYLYTDSVLNLELKQSLSFDKMEYLLGRFELDAQTFYGKSVENNDRFSKEPLMKMSLLTHNLLSGMDYDFIKKRREENFMYLHNKLNKINKLGVKMVHGPFMYPLLVEKGEEIKSLLIQKKIYIPTLWPEVKEVMAENSLECKYVKHIVALPVDQRYNAEDMEYVVKCLKQYL